jgi:hypothetical protein
MVLPAGPPPMTSTSQRSVIPSGFVSAIMSMQHLLKKSPGLDLTAYLDTTMGVNAGINRGKGMKGLSPFELEVARLLVDALEMEEVAPEDIDPDAPLFGNGLGLDSLDALEIALASPRRTDSSCARTTPKTFASSHRYAR